jgi:hypothetical protein
LLFQVIYIFFIGIPISSYLYSNFIFYKLEYPNLYKFLGKFIFYLFIILLTNFLFFLYFNIIAEIPVEFLVLENKTRYGNFVAFSPTESNTAEQNSLLNLKNQFTKDYARFMNLFSKQLADMSKLNNTTEVLGIECQFDLKPRGVQADSPDFF